MTNIILENEMLETYLEENDKGYHVYFLESGNPTTILRTGSLTQAREAFNNEVERYGHYGNYK